jgi:integrase
MRSIAPLSGVVDQLGNEARFFSAHAPVVGFVDNAHRQHMRVASKRCPSLASKRVLPHALRHSAAMELLQAGVDCSVIALWLGHEPIETTQTYLHAHLALK